MTCLTGKKIVLVTNIPRPYRVPLYETLARRIEETGGAFKVLFYSSPQRHTRRREARVPPARYPSASVAGLEIPLGADYVLSLPTRLLPALQAEKPDAVISGAFGHIGYLLWGYTRLHGIPYLQWSGAIGAARGWRQLRSTLARRWLARQARASITYGTRAGDYLIQLGARAERVVAGVNTVDTVWFAQEAQQAQPLASQLKAEHALQGVNLLYLGRLTPSKGLFLLVDALAQLEALTPFCLHIVGGGPSEGALKAHVKASRLASRVLFWGSQPSDRTPLFYALADVFLFPSLDDRWGLVLNEAMACGLPVIASLLAGATCDLVQDGVNGFVVDPRDTASLAKAIGRLVDDADLRARQGAAARATIEQRATIEHSAAAFLRALDLALA